MGNNRLRFVHNDKIFSTREEAKSYVNGQLIAIDRPALYAEPMVLRYGDDKNPNILLAIGSVGDGKTLSTDNRVFFIDAAEIQESISDILKDLSNITALKTIVDNIIESCELDENGIYSSDKTDDILLAAKTLKEADKLLSTAIQNETSRAKTEENKLTIYPKQTATIEHIVNRQLSGTTLESNVRIPDNMNISGTNYNNIIMQTNEGIFANVDVKYENDKLVVLINGVKKEFDLPKETFVDSGYYDKENESIVIVLNNGTKINIDVIDLIEEWGVDERQTSPIILSKEHISYEEVTHEQPSWKDILKADVRIKTDDNNILEKVKISETDDVYALYVNGSASNIKCWYSGEPTNVQEVLNNLKCEVSSHDGNIITYKLDGIYANVSLTYDKATNNLTFNDGVHAPSIIELNTASVLERAYYETGELVLVFRLTDGTEKVVRIPISDILKDFQFDNTNTTVTLARKVVNGQYYMYANVNVSSDPNNILEVNNHDLYVKGIASNIKYTGNTTVADALAKINGTSDIEGSIRNIVLQEAEARKAEDAKLTEKITTAQSDLTALTNKVDAEILRSETADTTHSEAIAKLTSDFDTHKEENISSFNEINGKINTISGDLENYKIVVDGEIDKVLVSANTYTDNVVTSAFTDAKLYTDTKVTQLDTKVNGVFDSITLTQHEDNPLYYELYIDGESHGKIMIPKDQFLKSVEYESTSKNLVFTFVTTDGDVVTKVDVTDLVDTYTASSGLSLNDNVFTVKINPASEYLTVTEDGVLLTGINTALSLKSDQAYVDEQLALKSDKTYVDGELAKKTDKEYVDSELLKKASKEYVDGQLVLKSDKTYVDGELAKKLDISAYTEGINEINLNLNQKADKTYVDGQLALKSDKTYVDGELAKKANTSDVEHSLGLKADKETVNESINQINTQLSQKANTSDVNESLKLKADKFTTLTTDTIKTILSASNELSSEVKLDASSANIIRSTSNGLIAKVSLTYDNLTSKLTFSDGISDPVEYTIAPQSLVTDVRYTEDGKLIMTIKLPDGETKEVEIVIDKLVGGTADGSPITILISDSNQGVRQITATLSVSNNPNNLIIANDGSLFASKLASDHKGTYRESEMTMQEILNKIALEITDLDGVTGSVSGNIESIQNQIDQLVKADEALSDKIDQNKTEIDNKITELSKDLTVIGSDTIKVESTESGKILSIQDGLTLSCGDYA